MTQGGRKHLEQRQDCLEEEYESIAESEAAEPGDRLREIRQNLRGVRHKLGPDQDSGRAFQWRVLSVLASKADISWEDEEGNKKYFEADLHNTHEWCSWINREMSHFGKYVFEKSWGKILIAYKSLASRLPVSELRRTRKTGFSLGPGQAVRLVRPPQLLSEVPSLFVWVPTEGKGRFPTRKGPAETTAGTSHSKGVHFSTFYTDVKRMSTPRRWAKECGGGMLHEFWHQAKCVLKKSPVQFCGWIPDIDGKKGDQAWLEVQQEIADQNLPLPQTRYDDYFATWFTWRMIGRLRDHFGHREGWTMPYP